MSHRIKHVTHIAFLGSALWGACGVGHATSYKWVGPDDGAWNNAANWSPPAVPGAEDTASIGPGKKVTVPRGASVTNLLVGAGAEIKNSGKIKVTGQTRSAGLFTGLGTLDVPEGAIAAFTVNTSSVLAADTRAKPTTGGGTGTTTPIPAVVFAPITNKGRIYTRVAAGCRVDFASIQNAGSAQIVSDGTVTFKDIKNSKNLAVRATGTLTFAKIENTSGASLYIAAPLPPVPVTPAGASTTSKKGDTPDTSDPSAVHLDSLTNRAGGQVRLYGATTGRYFNGKSISNAGQMRISGAQTLLDGDVVNSAGGILTLDSQATIFPADKKTPKLRNSGKIIKAAGSDATLNVEWSNGGQVVVGRGTLHVRVPKKKGCTQTDGVTTLEGGSLSVEDATQVSGAGTFDVRGGVVNGIGTIEGNVINSGGAFKPGHSPGTITINGNFTQTSGGVLDMELGGQTPGTGYDQILVNGTAYLGGTLNLLRWGTYVPHNGDVYTLFTYYAKVGNFANFVDASPVAGLGYSTTLTPTDYEVNCFTVDKTAPVASITSPVNGSARRAVTSAVGKASDASGIARVTCRLYRYANAATGVPAGFWAGGTSWTATASAANDQAAVGTTLWSFAFPVLAPGRYALQATATDAAGNSALSSAVSFWADPTAPSVLTVDTPLNGASVLALPAIGGAVSDGLDGSGVIAVRTQLRRLADGLYWNGSAWVSAAVSSPATVVGARWVRNTFLPLGINLKGGKYALAVSATDRAGNTKTVASSFTTIGLSDAPVASASGS